MSVSAHAHQLPGARYRDSAVELTALDVAGMRRRLRLQQLRRDRI